MNKDNIPGRMRTEWQAVHCLYSQSVSTIGGGHLQISHDIHLTEKQVLMKAKLIHYDQFANRCLSQPFTALVSNGEKFCKSRRVSYDVICTSIAVLAWCSTVPERSTVVRSTVVRWWLHLLNFYIRRHLTFPFKKWVDNANNMPVNIEKIKQRGRRRQAVEIL